MYRVNYGPRCRNTMLVDNDRKDAHKRNKWLQRKEIMLKQSTDPEETAAAQWSL